MPTNDELFAARIAAEAAQEADNERRAAEPGWPVNTDDGEVMIVKSHYEDGSRSTDRRILTAADRTEYALEAGHWVNRGKAAEAADAEPEAEPEQAPEGEKAADPLAEQVAAVADGDESKKEVK